jgi:phage-related protein
MLEPSLPASTGRATSVNGWKVVLSHRVLELSPGFAETTGSDLRSARVGGNLPLDGIRKLANNQEACLPRVEVLLHRDDDGTVPVLGWFRGLPEQAQERLRTRIERLVELGYELRRPEADYLRDGIYELRASSRRVQYRILYYFHGRSTVVISHGLIKEAIVPPSEIDRAVRRRRAFLVNPEAHANLEEIE